MQATRRPGESTRRKTRRLYTVVVRWSGWLMMHSGPLTPALLRGAARLHTWVIRRSYSGARQNPLPVDGLWLYHSGHPVLAHLMANGLFEPHVTRLIKTLLRPGMTVVDVGANIGYYSLLAARLVGEQGAVWAFEPAPSLADLLTRSIAENGYEGRVHVIPAAVGDVSGAATLHVNVAEPFLSSLYDETPENSRGGRAHDGRIELVEVRRTTLDDWAAAHGWPAVDLVKIDIEGGEKPALEGMAELSRRNPHLKLIIEFNVTALRSAGVTPTKFFATLQARGFNRVSVIGERPRVLDLPGDIAWLLREIPRRIPGDSVNLLCETALGLA